MEVGELTLRIKVLEKEKAKKAVTDFKEEVVDAGKEAAKSAGKIDDLGDAAEGAGKDLSKAGEGAKQAAGGLKEADKAADATKDALDKAGKEAKETASEFKQTGEAARKMGDEAKKAAAEMEAASERERKAAEKARQEQERSLKSQREARKQVLGMAYQGMQSFGSKATVGVTLPILATMGMGVKQAGDFESTLNLLQASLGATNAQMQKVSATALRLGADTKLPATSANDAAEAMFELAKAGFTVEQSMQSARGVLQMSAATGMANAEAAELTAKTIAQFGLAATDAERVANVLSATANKSSADVRELGQALAQGGGDARTAGLSLEQYAAALGVMANNGMAGSDAATSLKVAMGMVIQPTKDALPWLEKFKTSFIDKDGKMRDFNVFIRELSTGLDKLPDGRKAQALQAIFGMDGKRAMAALTSVTGALDTMQKGVAGTADSAKMAEAKMKGLNGAVEGLQSAFETAALKGATPFLHSITDLVKSGGGLLQWYADADAGTRNLVNSVGILALAMGPASSLVGNIGNATTGIIAMRTAMAASGLTMGGMAVAAAPWILAIAGVAAAGYGLYRVMDSLDQSTAKVTERAVDEAKAQENASRAKAEHMGKVMGLVTAYEKLRDKENKSNKEKETMRDLLDKIGQLSPDLVTGWNDQGHALDLAAGAAQRYADALKNANQEASIDRVRTVRTKIQGLTQQRADLKDVREALTSGNPAALTTPGAQGYFADIDREYREKGSAAAEALRATFLRQINEKINLIGQDGKRFQQELRDILNPVASAPPKKDPAKPPKKNDWSPSDGDGESGVRESASTSTIMALAKGIDTPAGSASCANFAGRLLNKLGYAVERNSLASGLRDNVIKAGGQKVGALEAQAGDLVVLYDPKKYGAKQPNGKKSGYHVGVNLGDGYMVDSSNGDDGRKRKIPLGDASFYRMPGSGRAAQAALRDMEPNFMASGIEDARQSALGYWDFLTTKANDALGKAKESWAEQNDPRNAVAKFHGFSLREYKDILAANPAKGREMIDSFHASRGQQDAMVDAWKKAQKPGIQQDAQAGAYRDYMDEKEGSARERLADLEHELNLLNARNDYERIRVEIEREYAALRPEVREKLIAYEIGNAARKAGVGGSGAGGILSAGLSSLPESLRDRLKEDFDARQERQREMRSMVADAAEREKERRIQAQADRVYELRSTVGDGMRGLFDDVISGSLDMRKGVVGAVEGMLGDIGRRIVSAQVDSWIANLVGGLIPGPKSGAGGTGIGAIFASAFGAVGKREDGGPMLANKPYIVGEKGPELVFPSHSGYVATAKETQAMRAGGGGNKAVNVVVNINNHSGGGKTGTGSNMSEYQLRRAVGEAVAEAMGR